MIKVKTFRADESPSYYDSFESWQQKNPQAKIIETKMFTETQTYTTQKIMVTYEEKELALIENQTSNQDDVSETDS